jgi:hypothetical protein
MACDTVIVQRPQPDAHYPNPLIVDLELRDIADQNTFRASLDGQDITGQFAFAGTPRRASAPMPRLERSPHILHVYADTSQNQPFVSTGRNITFRISTPLSGGGGGGGAGTSPAIDLQVPATLEVQWGGTASLNAILSSQNGFSGPVDLAIVNVPAGASASQTTVNLPSNGLASTQLLLTTTEALTDLHPSSIDIRAAPQAGASPLTQTTALRINRTAGLFSDPIAFGTASTQCNQDVSGVWLQPPQDPVPGPGVDIHAPSIPTGHTGHLDSVGFAFSAHCRAAVVYTPVDPNTSQPVVDLVNVDFPRSTGAREPGQIVANPPGFFFHGRFSPDDSLFVLLTQATTGGQYAAGLYDVTASTPTPIGSPKSFTATVDGISIGPGRDGVGRVVTLHTTPQISDPSWTVP